MAPNQTYLFSFVELWQHRPLRRGLNRQQILYISTLPAASGRFNSVLDQWIPSSTHKLCRKKSITVAGQKVTYHIICIHQWFLIHYRLNYSAALTLTRIRQCSDEKFIFEGLRQLAFLPSSSLSQLREPSNWKGEPERLFSQMVHWDNNRIVDLTILFSAIQSCERSEGTKVPQPISASSLPLVLRSDSGLTWHLHSGLMGASSSLSHTLEDVWLFKHFQSDGYLLTGQMKPREKASRRNGFLLDDSHFPVTRVFWLAYNSKIYLSSYVFPDFSTESS